MIKQFILMIKVIVSITFYLGKGGKGKK